MKIKMPQVNKVSHEEIAQALGAEIVGEEPWVSRPLSEAPTFPQRKIKLNVEALAEIVTENFAVHCEDSAEADPDDEGNWIVTHIGTGLAVTKYITHRAPAIWLAQMTEVLLQGYDTAGAGVRELGKAWMRVWEKVWERGTDQDAREATADELQWAFRPVGT